MSLVVAKIGGSLLGWPGLRRWLGGFLDEFGGSRLLLIAGGGGAADWVRRLDEAHGLGDEVAHELAMRSMDLSAHVLASLAEGTSVVEPEGLESAWAAGLTPILLARGLLARDDNESADPLPHRWEATSDSVAARLATRLQADTLILCKSAGPPTPPTRDEAAREGLVDPLFVSAARRLPSVIFRNARSPGSRGIMIL